MWNPASSAARGALLIAAALASFVAVPSAASAQMDANAAALDGARSMYEMVRDFIMTTATDTPEDLYAFRPTDEVRSLGELLGHVGNASFAFCSTVLGENSPASSDLEQAPSKDAMVAGLRTAFAYCDRAYSEPSPAQLAEQVNLFGMSGSKMWVLIFNATHDWEHYGNLVTYLRLNGIVPPSSRGSM
jgi:uncharacterized damage-inducible protein DinB